MLIRITLLALALLLSACSDPKAASTGNFKVAIQKMLDGAYPKCFVQATFPKTIDNNYDFSLKELNALTTAGLLSHKVETQEIEEKVGWVNSRVQKKTLVKSVYSLTEEGQKFYRPADEVKKTKGGFCFGKATVNEVTEFTEPADAGGVRSSRVTYTYQISDIPAWAKQPEVLAAIGGRLTGAVEAEKTPAKDMDMLVLTNNGWVSQMGAMLHAF